MARLASSNTVYSARPSVAVGAGSYGGAGVDNGNSVLVYTLRATLMSELLTNGPRRASISYLAATGNEESSLTSFVHNVFNTPDKSFNDIVKSIRRNLQIKHLCRDLKRYLDLLEMDQTPRHMPSNFDTAAGYDLWKCAERKVAVDAMVQLLRNHPKVSLESKRAKQSNANESLLFIPVEKHSYYRGLFQRCVELDASIDVSGHASNPLHLSTMSSQLLECVANRWRVSTAFRNTAVLDLLFKQYLKNHSLLSALLAHLDLMCTLEQTLTTEERMYLLDLLVRIKEEIEDQLKTVGVQSPLGAPEIPYVLQTLLTVLHVISTIPANSINQLNMTREYAKYIVKSICIQRYIHINSSSAMRQASDTLSQVIQLSLLVEAEVNQFSNINSATTPPLSPFSLPLPFHDRVLAWIPLHITTPDYLVRFFFTEVEKLWTTHTPRSSKGQIISLVFHCYDRLRKMHALYTDIRNAAISIGYKSPNGPVILLNRYDTWFNDCIDNWIEMTSENMTEIWTTRAMAEDKFQPTDNASHSTSVIDLCISFSQGLNAINLLPWPSYDHQYRAVKRFTKVICNTCFSYGNHMQSHIISSLLQCDTSDTESGSFNGANFESVKGNQNIKQAQSKSLIARFHKTWSDLSHSTSNQLSRSIPTGKGTVTNSVISSVGKNNPSSRVATHVMNKLKAPVMFVPSMCVRLNNISAVQLRMGSLYDNVSQIISSPADDYTSSFPSEQTLLRVTLGAFHSTMPTTTLSQDDLPLYYAEIMHNGKLIGRCTFTTDDRPIPSTGDDDDHSILVPIISLLSLQLSVYRSQGSNVTIIGSVNLALDCKKVSGHTIADEWVALNNGKGRMQCYYERVESKYISYWFRDVYEWLGATADNVLLMFVDQISTYVKLYVLQAVKRHKGVSIAHPKSFMNAQLLHSPTELTFESVELDIKPLLDYLNCNLEVLNTYLDERISNYFFLKLWKQLIYVVEEIAVTRVKKSGEWKRLKTRQIDVLSRVLQLFKDFFHAEGEGIPLQQLETDYYFKVSAILQMYHSPTEKLIQHYLSALNIYLSYKIERLDGQQNDRNSLSKPLQALFQQPLPNKMIGSPLLRAMTSTTAATNFDASRVVSPPVIDDFATLRRAHRKKYTLMRQKGNESPIIGPGPSRLKIGIIHPVTESKELNSRTSYGYDMDNISREKTSTNQVDNTQNSIQSYDSKLNANSLVNVDPKKQALVMSVDPAVTERIKTLASQEATWMLLILRSRTEQECREFVHQQEDTVKTIINNLERQEIDGSPGDSNISPKVQAAPRSVKDSAYF